MSQTIQNNYRPNLEEITDRIIWGCGHGLTSIAVTAFSLYQGIAGSLMYTFVNQTIWGIQQSAFNEFAAAGCLGGLVGYVVGSEAARSVGADRWSLFAGSVAGVAAFVLVRNIPFAMSTAFLVAASTAVYRRD